MTPNVQVVISVSVMSVVGSLPHSLITSANSRNFAGEPCRIGSLPLPTMEHTNARAGPSNPRKKQQKQKKSNRMSRAKMESKAIDELDELAMNFVRLCYDDLCDVTC